MCVKVLDIYSLLHSWYFIIKLYLFNVKSKIPTVPFCSPSTHNSKGALRVSKQMLYIKLLMEPWINRLASIRLVYARKIHLLYLNSYIIQYVNSIVMFLKVNDKIYWTQCLFLKSVVVLATEGILPPTVSRTNNYGIKKIVTRSDSIVWKRAHAGNTMIPYYDEMHASNWCIFSPKKIY